MPRPIKAYFLNSIPSKALAFSNVMQIYKFFPCNDVQHNQNLRRSRSGCRFSQNEA